MFISAFSKGTPAFSVVQLLWINMIMDILAALALAAERPQMSVIKNPPVKNSDSIITDTMWRQILGMSAYIIFISIIMIYFADNIWALDYSNADTWINEDGTASNKCKVFTLIFNAFIYLNMFNMINSRKVKGDQLNVFEHIFDNFYFLGVFASVCVV